MRLKLALVFVAAAVGCDSGGGGSKADMAMKIMSKDMSTQPVNCDVVKQDCGGGKRCVAAWDGSGGSSGSCVTDGTVAAGGACMFASDPTTLLDDNCKAGSTCDDLIGTGNPVCRKYCAANTDCASGEVCADMATIYGFANPPGFGWCEPSCTPFSSAAGNCPSNFDCGEDWYLVEQTDPTNPTAGFFFCKKTGTGAAYASCDNGMGGPDDTKCGANLWCNDINGGQGTPQYLCFENCDMAGTHACSMPPADAGMGGVSVACVPFSNTNGLGYCYQM
jgi:hypothetical protein